MPTLTISNALNSQLPKAFKSSVSGNATKCAEEFELFKAEFESFDDITAALMQMSDKYKIRVDSRYNGRAKFYLSQGLAIMVSWKPGHGANCVAYAWSNQ